MKNIGIILKSTAIVLPLVYFIGFWFYKLDVLPGLHGDEAWFGLKAELYTRSGVDRLLGMNGYTGILQSLASSIAFRHFSIDIFYLRLPGVICNSLTLLGVVALLLRTQKFRTTIVFLLFLIQSGSFLLYPKIAWEVTSFNYMFLAIVVLSMFEIVGSAKPKPVQVFLFLFVNVFGTYNHIIFSTIALALLGGTMIWLAYNKDYERIPLLSLFILNAFNIFLLEVVLRFYSKNLLSGTDYWPFVLMVAGIVLQSFYAGKLARWSYPLLRYLYRIEVPESLLQVVLAVFLLGFIYLHGVGLLHAVANDAIITNLFSYQFSEPVSFLLIATGIVIVMVFFIYLIEDVFSQTSSLHGVMISVYLGVFSVYVRAPSVRYYILVCAIMCAYLTYEITRRSLYKRSTLLVAASLTISILLTNVALWEVYSDPYRKLRAVSFTIGNSSFETSAHFLPNRPLIDFMKNHKIGEVSGESRFIREPVLFYKKMENWENIPSRKLTVSYDYATYNSGFLMGFRDSSVVAAVIEKKKN